jgi:hypothetical protein
VEFFAPTCVHSLWRAHCHVPLIPLLTYFTKRVATCRSVQPSCTQYNRHLKSQNSLLRPLHRPHHRLRLRSRARPSPRHRVPSPPSLPHLSQLTSTKRTSPLFLHNHRLQRRRNPLARPHKQHRLPARLRPRDPIHRSPRRLVPRLPRRICRRRTNHSLQARPAIQAPLRLVSSSTRDKSPIDVLRHPESLVHGVWDRVSLSEYQRARALRCALVRRIRLR